MGINDRDYYRQTTSGSPLLTGGAPICAQLIAANIIVFVLQLLTQTSQTFNVTAWLELDPVRVIEQGQVWRLITHGFCHDPGSPYHILFNMLGLWFFGPALEAMYGSREFLKFYLTAILAGGVCFVGLAFATHDPNPAIGASGAIMAVLMLYALYYPRNQIYIFFVVPVEIRWIVMLYVIFDLFPVLQQLGGAAAGSDGVAHAAHLGGLFYGYLYKRFDLRYGGRWLPKWNWSLSRFWRNTQRRRSLHVYQPEDRPNLERQVDEILAKISTHGEASLTDREREILKEASRRYKNR
jgi:membrane associated rhomboid family serine protease